MSWFHEPPHDSPFEFCDTSFFTSVLKLTLFLRSISSGGSVPGLSNSDSPQKLERISPEPRRSELGPSTAPSDVDLLFILSVLSFLENVCTASAIVVGSTAE